MLRERRIGAVEPLELRLDQIGKHNATLNTVVARDVDGALEAARQAHRFTTASEFNIL